MKDKLQFKLKFEGRSLRWFHREYVSEMTYNALALQLNGYALISEQAKNAVKKYLDE